MSTEHDVWETLAKDSNFTVDFYKETTAVRHLYNSSHLMETYLVNFLEPKSGKLCKVYLYHGVNEDEVRLSLEAAFSIGQIVGFMDEDRVMYTVSALTRLSKHFDGLCLTVVVGDAPIYILPSVIPGNLCVESTDEEAIRTEENAEKAFNILDKNGDGYIHKDEIVDVLTVAFGKLLDSNTRYAFAYSCLSASSIALAAARNMLSSVYSKEGDYALDLDDFCAWYLSGGTQALRELTIVALEFVSTMAHASPGRSMKRSKSTTALDLGTLYSDEKLASFVARCQSLLRLSVDGSLSYLLDLLALSVKGRSVISHEMYTKVFYVYFLHQEYQLTERDTDIMETLDTIFNLLSSNARDKVHLLDLGSVLCAASNGKYLQALKTLFDLYPDSSTGFVTENILSNHLCQVLRLIFYFNPALPENTGSSPEDLSCALSIKVLQLSESNRKVLHKLSFEEFVESFLHGLMLGLNLLQIHRGYFYDYLESLMSYIGDNTLRAEGGSDGEEEEDVGEDSQSSSADSSGRSEETTESIGDDVDTEAATARVTTATEDDTLEAWDDSESEESSRG